MFRIETLEIIKHSFFKPQTFTFVDFDDSEDGPYITLLIGPNGTGKSQVLELVTEIFNVLSASQEKEQKVQKLSFDFDLKYKIGNDVVEIKSIGNNETFKVNEREKSLHSIPLPSKFVGSAINLTDRFPNLTSRRKIYNKRYEYLGIRAASNNAFIKTHIKNVIQRLTTAIQSEANIPRFKHLFTHLGLKPQVQLTLKAGQRFSKARNSIEVPSYLLSPEGIRSHFQELISKINKENRMTIRYEKYKKAIEERDEIERAIEFIRANQETFSRKRKGDIKYRPILKFDEPDSINKWIVESKALAILEELDLLVLDSLHISRANSNYSFDNASSGEHHILSSFIGILSTIDDNSLIMIDEPEISLHPNWQIQYIDLLTKSFSDYSNCHFLISTHSHFLVTDLVPDKSTIVSFQNDEDGRVISETLDFETHGWSTENILYRVFGVSSVRNHYLEMDVRQLLTMISNKSDDKQGIQAIVHRLSKFNITSDDPLNGVIQNAKSYLQNYAD